MDDENTPQEDLHEDVRTSMLAAMYGNDDEDDGPREQPPQLRYAGKATVVNIDGQQVVIPRIEYIEAMEAGLRALKDENAKLRARVRKLEMMHARDTNIASNRIRTVESELRAVETELREELQNKISRRSA